MQLYQIGHYYKRGNDTLVFKVKSIINQTSTYVLLEVIVYREGKYSNAYSPTSTATAWGLISVPVNPSTPFETTIFSHEDDYELSESELTFELI